MRFATPRRARACAPHLPEIPPAGLHLPLELSSDVKHGPLLGDALQRQPTVQVATTRPVLTLTLTLIHIRLRRWYQRRRHVLAAEVRRLLQGMLQTLHAGLNCSPTSTT